MRIKDLAQKLDGKGKELEELKASIPKRESDFKAEIERLKKEIDTKNNEITDWMANSQENQRKFTNANNLLKIENEQLRVSLSTSQMNSANLSIEIKSLLDKISELENDSGNK
jgi:chromosome segregation ATPase